MFLNAKFVHTVSSMSIFEGRTNTLFILNSSLLSTSKCLEAFLHSNLLFQGADIKTFNGDQLHALFDHCSLLKYRWLKNDWGQGGFSYMSQLEIPIGRMTMNTKPGNGNRFKFINNEYKHVALCTGTGTLLLILS